MSTTPRIRLINGIAGTDTNKSWEPYEFDFGVFDKAPAFAMIGGDFMGFGTDNVPARECWAQEWAAARDSSGWFSESGEPAGVDHGSLIVLVESSLGIDAEAAGTFYADNGTISKAGGIYTESVHDAMISVGWHVADRARSKWPEHVARVAFTSMLDQPAFNAKRPPKPAKNALSVAEWLKPRGFALAVGLRFDRRGEPKTLAEAEAWSAMALSAREPFDGAFAFGHSPWDGVPGVLPHPHQLAGAMRACAIAGVPLVVTGVAATIEKAVGLDTFANNIIAARQMAELGELDRA